MDRRTLLSLAPALALPATAEAAPSPIYESEHPNRFFGGVPIVDADGMLELVRGYDGTFETAPPELQKLLRNSLFCFASQQGDRLTIVDTRPDQGVRFEWSDPNPVLGEAADNSAQHRLAVLRVVIERAIENAPPEVGDTRPDFKADRCYRFWSEEDKAHLHATTRGPLGYRWDDGEHYGAIAFPQRITSAWMAFGGPKR